MPIKCEEYSQVCVVEVQGDFVGENITLAQKGIEEHIEVRRVVDFVLDFNACGFIDSEGLEALLAIKRRCEDLFGQLKLVRLDESCRKIMEITRLEHRFECHDDLAKALKTMR
jgi:anti-anti-sigma factor